MSETTISPSQRPSIASFATVPEYLKAMLEHLKATDAQFSVLKATRNLRKISPTLVSLILSGKRKMTLDRLDEFAKLLKLNTSEKIFLRNWIEEKNPQAAAEKLARPNKNRKEASPHLLQDWLNVYVKDAFEIEAIQSNPEIVYRKLGGIAGKSRIDKSMQFLLTEGYLRKTLDGKILPDVPQSVVESPLPHIKIRQFHKAALTIARDAIDSHPANERYANTLVLSMDQEKYQELIQIIQEFSEKLKDFAVQTHGPDLFQVIVNVSPSGGKTE